MAVGIQDEIASLQITIDALTSHVGILTGDNEGLYDEIALRDIEIERLERRIAALESAPRLVIGSSHG